MANNANRKGLAILMRLKMRTPDGRLANASDMQPSDARCDGEAAQRQPEAVIDTVAGTRTDRQASDPQEHSTRILEAVQKLMHGAIHMKKTDTTDLTLTQFSQDYLKLGSGNRQKLLFSLATQYGVNRSEVQDLIHHYLGLQNDEHGQRSDLDEEGLLSALYRTEKNLRYALKPLYTTLFERLNAHPGGLKFLVDLRADLNVAIEEENSAPLRALDSDLKEKLATWLSPAVLELHRITWNDSASLLEKIVAYEAVHPINNLHDLKRRLGVGHRCFGYLHPAIPGEPLIFIEVALMRGLAQSIQEVLWDEPPIAESESTTALFYSISSTQPGLTGINLGKFLIKRVVDLLRQEMPHVKMFATLSPIPGFMQWLLSKLASQSKLAHSSSARDTDLMEEASASTFKENLLLPEEEKAIMDACVETDGSSNAMQIMYKLLISSRHDWAKSEALSSVLCPPLMRLCTRYILKEKKRGKALDPITNFHVQNGAIVERLNWMADLSDKALHQSAGIMVNYLYRLDEIEENAQTYFNTGYIRTSPHIEDYLKVPPRS
eukprot:Gb_39933 [translate_table: standard]